ncbi:hypothetical protein [Clostridium sp. 'White wine YQ']|uniref:hypothetical protein n=1 Tax=Clostridium sp. 'White wine YQ' TaxID=3027474 RepID=UPI002366FFC6|nr:hypothetical protein [Clostridium sp. 'White wine YQ']MDD7793059.1 hypothetical protein [Clostridium sp. 'White wine YQ']
MIDRIKSKIIALLDEDSSKFPLIVYIIIPLLMSSIAKVIGYDSIFVLMMSITILTAISAIIEIVRKKKNIRNFTIYSIITLLGILCSVMIKLGGYFFDSGNTTAGVNVIKVFLGIISLFVDIIGILFIIDKGNPVNKKITITFSMIIINAVTILALIFLPPKNM